MSEPGETNGRALSSDLPPDAEVSGEAVRDFVRGALAEPDDVPDLTRGFQRKIRERSGGKFYTDGWSTAKHPPLNTYLVTSLMMLFVLGVIYALLAPLSGEPVKPPASKPVNVLPVERGE